MKYISLIRLLLIVITIAGPGSALLRAKVVPGSPFGDHMVLQRNQPIPIWGRADPGEKVSVTLNNTDVSTVAEPSGKWSLRLPAMPAAGPLKITIQGDNTITFQDVYIGEVWLCSGQSNMDMTVAREDRYWCGVLHEEQEVAAAKYPLIRFFDVAFSTRDTPQEFCSGTWEVVSPQTVGHMSAAAYFFAREILKTQKVAVGLLTSAYGASTAEAWTRREALEQNGQVAYLVNNYDEAARRWDSGEAQKEMDAATEAWSVISRKVMDDINFLTSIRECITCPESNRDTAAARLKQLRQPPRPARIRNPHEDQHSPSVLWNAMIQPLVPFGIRGAIWYQGESNGPSRHVYQQLMETLIRDWRRAWGQGDFPFLYVQLANIDSVQREPHQGNEGPYELFVREAQLRNLSVPHTAMAVAIDNADPEDLRNVHPKDKATIGYRLALAARALAYGEKNLEYMGPVFSHVEIKGNEARLFFKHTGKGLMARDGLKGFAIAGQDRIYHWGQARIEGNAVVVTHPDISRPAAVRYGWARNPVTSLYNKDGLPASPFRTE